MVKNSPAKAGDIGDMGLISGLGGSQESLAANSTGEFDGQRSLAG